MSRSVPAFLLLLFGACSPAVRPAPASAEPNGVRIQLEATPGSGPSIGLAFVVFAPQEVSIQVPTIPQRLRAFVDGVEVPIAQPTFDLPVVQKRFPAGPDTPAHVPCPVHVTFGTDAGSGFTWTIQHTPTPTIELEASLEVNGHVLLAPRVTVRMGE